MTTRVRYGLRAVVDLARRGVWEGSAARPVPLSRIGKAQEIPEPFLRQIFHSLRRARLLEVEMGQAGGYRLARRPDRITARDVVEALGERIEPLPCTMRRSSCGKARECPSHPLWRRIADLLRKALSMTTLSDLAGLCPVRGRQPKARLHLF